MLVRDWFMWQFPRDRKILDPKKKLLRENLTTPNERIQTEHKLTG